jgi:molecular chaperone GrpE
LKKILPRIDDFERIINNTPEDLKGNPLYEWIISTLDKLLKDLEKLWVKAFVSIWEEVNPDKHEVVTVLPWKEENIIIDEFEKWYMLNDKILRHAKVVVWSGE